MNCSSAQLKRLARGALKGRWGLMMGALVLAGLISGLINSFVGIFLGASLSLPLLLIRIAVSYLITALIGMFQTGISRIALCVSRGQTGSLADMFYAFRHQTDQFLTLHLILALIGSILTLPVYYMQYLVFLGELAQLPYLLLLYGYTILCTVLQVLFTLCFTLADYLLIDRPSFSATEALGESVRLMRGRKWRLCRLYLSFIGIYLLGYLSACIGFLWIGPYLSTTQAFFYRDAIQDLPQKPQIPQMPQNPWSPQGPQMSQNPWNPQGSQMSQNPWNPQDPQGPRSPQGPQDSQNDLYR